MQNEPTLICRNTIAMAALSTSLTTRPPRRCALNTAGEVSQIIRTLYHSTPPPTTTSVDLRECNGSVLCP